MPTIAFAVVLFFVVAVIWHEERKVRKVRKEVKERVRLSREEYDKEMEQHD